jgi:hypothetical protein
VLALNIFHHFIRRESTYHRLIGLLRRLRMQVMFFEPHLPDEPQMQSAYWNPRPDEFVQFIAEHTGLRTWVCSGTAEYDRPIYRLSAA